MFKFKILYGSGSNEKVYFPEWMKHGDNSGKTGSEPLYNIQIGNENIKVHNMHRASGKFLKQPEDHMKNIFDKFDERNDKNKTIMCGDSNIYYGLYDNDAKKFAITQTLNKLREFVRGRYQNENIPYIFVSKKLVKKVRPNNTFRNSQAAVKVGTKILDTMMFIIPKSILDNNTIEYNKELFAEIMYEEPQFNFDNQYLNNYEDNVYISYNGAQRSIETNGGIITDDVNSFPDEIHTIGNQTGGVYNCLPSKETVIEQLNISTFEPMQKKDDPFALPLKLNQDDFHYDGQDNLPKGHPYHDFMKSREKLIKEAHEKILNEKVMVDKNGNIYSISDLVNIDRDRFLDLCYKDFVKNTMRKDKQSMNYFVNKFFSLLLTVSIGGFETLFKDKDGIVDINSRIEWNNKFFKFIRAYDADHLFGCEFPVDKEAAKKKKEFVHFRTVYKILEGKKRPVLRNTLSDHVVVYIDIIPKDKRHSKKRLLIFNGLGLSVDSDRGIVLNTKNPNAVSVNEQPIWTDESVKKLGRLPNDEDSKKILEFAREVCKDLHQKLISADKENKVFINQVS